MIVAVAFARFLGKSRLFSASAFSLSSEDISLLGQVSLVGSRSWVLQTLGVSFLPSAQETIE